MDLIFDRNFLSTLRLQRKNLVKQTPVIMPIVTERFDLEKYAHVDAMLANFQGVFMSDVRL